MTRGTLYQIISRFGFLLSSYLIQILMAYFLVDPKDYGDLGVIISIVTLARVFLSTGLPQTTSRFVALYEEHEGSIFRKTLQIQLLCALAILVIYVAGIPLWTRILNDKALSPYLLASSPLIILFAVMQIYLAYLNGKGCFGWQALYIGLYSAGRFILAITLVIMGMQIMGVLLGFVLAAIITLLAIIIKVKIPKSTGTYSASELVRFSLPIIIFSMGITTILNFDILLLKHFFSESPIIGYYTAAMNLGKLPYFVLFAYSVTLLPMTAKALGDEDKQKAQSIVRRSITSQAILAVLGIALIAATAEPLMDFVYPEEYRIAANALKILFCSMCGLALLHSFSSIITAKGKPHVTMAIVLLCLPIQFGFGVWLAPKCDIIGVAVANLAAVTFGVVFAAATVFRYFGVFFEASKVAKAGIASGVMFCIIGVLPDYPVYILPLVYVLGLFLFGVTMIVLGGFSREDLKKIIDRLSSMRNP